MPVKMRRTSSRQASSTNIHQHQIAAKMGVAAMTSTQHPPADKEVEKPIRKRTTSSQALAHNQPRPFSRTGSSTKLTTKNGTKQGDQQTVVGSQPADDDDWVSSSSAVPSPAPEQEDEEEEEAMIYVNNINQRSNQVDDAPATPRRLNHRLSNQRHNPSQVMAHLPDEILVPDGGAHPTNATPQRHQNNVPTESSHIHFAATNEHETHPPDTRIHRNGENHHFSPPTTPTAGPSADLVEPGTSVIRITEPPVPDQSTKTESPHRNNVNGKKGSDDQTNGNRRTSARLQQDQIDTSPYARQIAATHSIRPAVSGNGNTSDHHAPQVQGDIGRTSQRGFGAVPTPLLQQHVNDASQPPPLVPAISEAVTHPNPAPARIRPSMLRRDTTPTAVSRSPVAIDTPPRASTPPASMTHDEMVANNHKRHSIHSTGGHARPLSLFQPTSQGKRLSLSSRPGSAHYALGQIHGKNNPLALLIRLNPGSNLAAPAIVSPSYDGTDRDSESAYMAMSPTRSRSLRKKTSLSSLNSVATAPVISTTSAVASGSSASPTSALATSSSAMLKHLSTSAHSDTRPDALRADDKPLFVSQFYPSNGLAPGQAGKRRGKSIGQMMTGSLEWRSHETAMKHRGLMTESFNRISAARAASAGSRRR